MNLPYRSWHASHTLPGPIAAGFGTWGGREEGAGPVAGRGLPYAFDQRRCPAAGGIPRSGRGYSYAAAGCGAASLRNAAARPKVSPMV